MKYRLLIIHVLASVSLCLARERPNVVLVITDDQNDYYMSRSGVDVHTPSMDRLSRQSISFANAYCASPVCGPSRASLFSGLYPHHTGAYLNGADPWLKSTQLKAAETLPELFRRGGYETWGMGKLFHAKLPPDRERVQWDNRAKANGGFGPFADKRHQLSGKFFSVQEWDGPDEEFPDVRSANQAIDFLRERESEKPFFLVYGLWRPHNPWTAPRRFFDQYQPEQIVFPPPGYESSDLDDVPSPGRDLAAIYKQRWDQFGDSNPDAWKRIVHGYLACTSFADWNLGRLIDALDATEFASNTIVIVTADNGYHVGEKHHYGKSTLWEKSARVPLLIRLPQRRNAAKTSKAAVGLIDLYPTLQSVCQLPTARQRLDGRNLTGLLADPNLDWPHPAITTYGENKTSVRRGQWRYIQYPDGTDELYDHSSDPHELHNLADRPELERLKIEFRQAIPDSFAKSLGGRNG